MPDGEPGNQGNPASMGARQKMGFVKLFDCQLLAIAGQGYKMSRKMRFFAGFWKRRQLLKT